MPQTSVASTILSFIETRLQSLSGLCAESIQQQLMIGRATNWLDAVVWNGTVMHSS